MLCCFVPSFVTVFFYVSLFYPLLMMSIESDRSKVDSSDVCTVGSTYTCFTSPNHLLSAPLTLSRLSFSLYGTTKRYMFFFYDTICDEVRIATLDLADYNCSIVSCSSSVAVSIMFASVCSLLTVPLSVSFLLCSFPLLADLRFIALSFPLIFASRFLLSPYFSLLFITRSYFLLITLYVIVLLLYCFFIN